MAPNRRNRDEADYALLQLPGFVTGQQRCPRPRKPPDV
jgi:hypothetical protein